MTEVALFPITDQSRAGDIRMRRRRATWFLAGTALSVFLLVGHDDRRHSEPSGEQARWLRDAAVQARMAVEQGRLAAEQARLAAEQMHGALATGATVRSEGGWISRDLPITGPVVIALHCDHPLRIETGSTAGDVMEVTALSQHGDGASALQTLRDDGGTLSGSCGDASISNLTVKLPPRHPVTIIQNGDENISVGTFADPVTVNVLGSGDVRMDGTNTLAAVLRGSGNVSVREMTGDLSVDIHESGDFKLDGGQISRLNLTSSGPGSIDLRSASVINAYIRNDGEGDIRIGRVQNWLDAKLYGDGNIVIAEAEVGNARLTASGDGKLEIASGRIGVLEASRTGDGTLSVQAHVTSGTLSESGDGTTDIPHATLRLTPAGT